jgi:hypothetical protein
MRFLREVRALIVQESLLLVNDKVFRFTAHFSETAAVMSEQMYDMVWQ